MRSTCFSYLLVACAAAGATQAQLTIAPGTASYVHISTNGTPILSAGDDTSHTIITTIGNDLLPAGPVTVTTNGYVASGSLPGSSTPYNAPITSTTTPGFFGTASYPATTKIVCPWWDDLFATPFPNTTLYWKEVGNTLYIEWKNIGHYNTLGGTFGPAITFQIQVVQKTCGLSQIHMVYFDAVFAGLQAANDLAASATVGYVGGTPATNAQWSYDTPGAIQGGTSLTISYSQLENVWSSPSGPGSLRIDMCGGTAGASYQLLATLNAGSFPNGWLLGLDITSPELMGEVGVFPFYAPLDASGGMTIGPFTGLPPGTTIYSRLLGFPPGGVVPATQTPPLAYTIP